MSIISRRKSFREAIRVGLALFFGASASMLSAATLPTGFVETQFGSNLGGAPTAMAFAPDGRLFVCLQGGQLRVIKNGALLATPFVTLSVNASGERGLLGVTFDPNFATNQFVYVYYTTSTAPIHNRISRFTANGDIAATNSEVVIMDLDNLSTATNHNGGAIHFGPDGKLYAAVGENANSAHAQSFSNRLGKMLRINSDGTIPTDNPFFNTATGANRSIWALGLRNPFTFNFQPGTGRIFINDVGAGTWEEINDGIAGSNYGWPACEGDCAALNPDFRDPLFQYGHGNSPTTGCAIVGAAFYNPPVNQFPSSYIGKFFFADACSGWIRVFDPATGTASAFATGISSPVDLQVGPDGALYYLARGNNGQVFRVTAVASQPLNISVRSRVGTGNDVMISGFIITAGSAKKVILRGLGPSLQQADVPNPLPDPFLELHAGDSSLISANNNWKDNTPAQQLEITSNQLAPSNDLESAIVATLQPGTYTAIIRGQDNSSGVGLLEVYDVDRAATARLVNISGRASVQTGTNVLISGFIVGQNIGAAKVIVRGMGPSLAQSGIANPLADPTLELRDNNGALVIGNDNWQDDANQVAQISASGLAPGNAQESAIATSLVPGTYTAIVAGKNGGTGVGLVEVYNLP
ncbi:MAG TPA: PQQ-dependent sugar dehydrogenase [Chthoniobacterales bacterium]|nr:PQQ-dependent sugar dehydrogenase [Chthoniobacterales bacterium]